jgi:hypothetical protein
MMLIKWSCNCKQKQQITGLGFEEIALILLFLTKKTDKTISCIAIFIPCLIFDCNFIFNKTQQ